MQIQNKKPNANHLTDFTEALLHTPKPKEKHLWKCERCGNLFSGKKSKYCKPCRGDLMP